VKKVYEKERGEGGGNRDREQREKE
jgi:hypothetical protein